MACTCGHSVEEHGHDPKHPGSTACTECDCIAYEEDEELPMLQRPELDQESQELLSIADYIDQHGWAQCKFHAEDGSVCILGALRQLRIKIPVSSRGGSTGRLRDYIEKKYGHRSIMRWNDSNCTSKDEVVNTIREVAYNKE